MSINLNSIVWDDAKVKIQDADGDILAIDASGKITSIIEDGGGSITVDAVDLDIRDLAFATDKVDVSGSSVSVSGDVNVTQGTSPWVVGDGGGSLTVDGTVELGATTLAALETITVDSITNPVAVTQSGSWSVAVSNLTMYAEDSAHVSGDMGMMPLAVRSDNPVSLVSANGDYSPLIVGSNGKLWVKTGAENNNGAANATGFSMGVSGWDGTNQYMLKTDANGRLQVDINSLPSISVTQDGYSSWKVTATTVGTSEVQLVSTPLANRMRVEIQNLSDKDLYIKDATGVTTANGLCIPKKNTQDIELDAGAAIYAIASGAGADIRVAEYAF